LEVRWFVRGPLAPEAQAWFAALGPLPPEEARTDRYLIPTEGGALGLKVREGAVEVKQRTGSVSRVGLAAGQEGRVEAWRKWRLGPPGGRPALGWVDVAKRRRQRRLVAAGRSRCALELAEVVANGEAWWSVGLEASGGEIADRWRVFRAASRRWLPGAPPLARHASMGYPRWLREAAPGSAR
jgi:hypothetical protein